MLVTLFFLLPLPHPSPKYFTAGACDLRCCWYRWREYPPSHCVSGWAAPLARVPALSLPANKRVAFLLACQGLIRRLGNCPPANEDRTHGTHPSVQPHEVG